MWFRVLVLVMAAMLLSKALIALANPERFYAERQRQYASPTPPAKVLIGPVVLVALAVASWYAAIVHYEPWGWLVTGCLTAFASLSVHQTLRWGTHRHRMGRVVASANVWKVDCVLLAIGALLVTLAFVVY